MYSIDTKKVVWSRFYMYDGHATDGSNSQRWICKKCSTSIIISASTYANAKRHYTLTHDKIPEDELVHKRNPASFFQPSDGVLLRRNEKQSSFDAAVLQLITEDGISFRVIDSRNFRQMVSVLDNNIQVKSRRTYVRNIANQIRDTVISS
jgi:uncharacterized protein YegL